MIKSSNNEPLVIDKNAVKSGVNSILSMLEIIRQPLFPRNIMTASYNGFFPVHDVNQLLNAFEKAKFRDCRISAYPPMTKDNLSMLVPNMLLLDLDLDHKLVTFKSKRIADGALRNKVNRILAKLQAVYHIFNFMVLWTSNGRHILIPLGFDRPFEHIIEFSRYSDILPPSISVSEEFLSFAKNHLTISQADPNNYPRFPTIFLRVPGTLNTKRKYGLMDIVKIEHEWNYHYKDIPGYKEFYPSTDFLYEFMGYLDDKALAYKIKLDQQNKLPLSSSKSKLITWIETLWNTPLHDCRKRIIWLILSRYAINRRNMTHQEAFIWIKNWTDRCDAMETVTGITDEYINYHIASAIESGYFPPSIETLERYGWKMTGGIDLLDLIRNKRVS
jgi:hypothetical protein